MNLPLTAVLVSLLTPLSAQAQTPKPQAPSDVLVTIDGLPISRKELADRIWAKHADQELNLLVDELVLNKAVTAWRLKRTPKQEQATATEIEARLKSIKSRFKDDAAFAADLQKNGLQLAGLETQLREQLDREQLIVSTRNLSVEPAELKQFFEANKEKLAGPPAVRLRHLVVATEAQAKDLLASVRVGADFAKLAQQVSIDAGTKEKGGDLGFVTASMVPQEFQEKIMSLKTGEVSEVLRLSEGFHVFKAEERREPKAPVFEEIKKDLAQAVLARKIEQVLPGYLAELRAQSKIVPAPGVSAPPPAALKAN